MELESLYPDYQPISLASPLSLAELEANVSRIDAEIAQLQVERRQVYKNWRKSKASIAPITHLPIETIRVRHSQPPDIGVCQLFSANLPRVRGHGHYFEILREATVAANVPAAGLSIMASNSRFN